MFRMVMWFWMVMWFLGALQTVFLTPSPSFAMFRLDAFSVWTRILVVINLAVLWSIFWRIRMKG
jgi:hypothetical protein